MDERVTSWGRVLHAVHDVHVPSDRFAPLPSRPVSMLPYGNGRSYGDSCLNPGGMLVKTRGLDRFIAFDPDTGVLRCESGVLLSEILRLFMRRGWFLPVTPGTRFVTVGGAIANDVHGKNHHVAGTFGCHVRRFELLRSDGSRRECSAGEHAALFGATIGGLGLTGLVTWAELQLRRVPGPWIDAETIAYGSVDEFFALCDASDREHEYTVAWTDCTASGRGLGRGLFTRGNHAVATQRERTPATRRFPFVPPVSLVNGWTVRAFNAAYWRRGRRTAGRRLQHHLPFFYPLDAILDWNRMYGPGGFFQYQCVLPQALARDALRELLQATAAARRGSFLAVLKRCGTRASPGWLSFPMPGVSLALDFANTGAGLAALLARLDAVVHAAGGRLYPAKDGRMPGWLFRGGYPRWREFREQVDPGFSSAFWRRMMDEA